MRSGSGWDKLYSYRLIWITNYQIWPIPDEVNHMSIGPCCLFQGGKQVPTPGYSYQWWDPAKGYHSHKPYQLRVVTNFQQACNIIAPSTVYTVEDTDDDYACMCVHEKRSFIFQKNYFYHFSTILPLKIGAIERLTHASVLFQLWTHHYR